MAFSLCFCCFVFWSHEKEFKRCTVVWSATFQAQAMPALTETCSIATYSHALSCSILRLSEWRLPASNLTRRAALMLC
jgi:hypothetical protein